MDTQCTRDDIYQLNAVNPDWRTNPVRTLYELVRSGNVAATRALLCTCQCVPPDGWQFLAETAAKSGSLDMLLLLRNYAFFNWAPIEDIARAYDHTAITDFLTGERIPIAQGPDTYREQPNEDFSNTGDYYEERYDESQDASEAYEDNTDWIVGSRPPNAFRNMQTHTLIGGSEGYDVDNERMRDPTDEDFLPEEALPFEDEHPLFDDRGWGWEGYLPIYEPNDDDEGSILHLAYPQYK